MSSDHERYADPNYRYNTWAGNPKGNAAHPDYCRWEVFQNHLFHQCSRKAKIDGLWCRWHSPEYMAKQEAKRQARWAEESRKWERRRRTSELNEKALAALIEIAKGEMNDPAGYAAMILEEYEDVLEAKLS